MINIINTKDSKIIIFDHTASMVKMNVDIKVYKNEKDTKKILRLINKLKNDNENDQNFKKV